MIQNKSNLKLQYSAIGIFLFLLYMYINSTKLLVYRTDKIAALSLILALIFFIPSLVANPKGNKLTHWDAVWFIALLFITIRNNDLADGNIYEYAETAACVLIIMLAGHTRNWHYAFLKLLGIFGAVHIVLGFVFYVLPEFYMNRIVPLMGLDDYWTFRIQEMLNSGFMVGFTSHHSTLGIYISVTLMLIVSYIFAKKHKKEKYLYFFLIITVFAFLLNGKRGPFLFSIISAAIVYLIGVYRGTINNFLKIMIGLIIGGIAFIIAANTVEPVINFLNRFASAQNFNDLTSGRVVDLWLPALILFSQSPFLGIGWRGFTYNFQEFSLMVQENDAHNIYLQLLCETGLVGFLIFMYIFFSTYVKSVKILKSYVARDAEAQDKKIKTMLYFSLIVQTFFLLEGLVGNTLYGLTFFIYALCVGFIYSIDNGILKLCEAE